MPVMLTVISIKYYYSKIHMVNNTFCVCSVTGMTVYFENVGEQTSSYHS